MSNEANRLTDDVQVRAHGEDTPDVEGHIRRAHTMNEIRVEAPAESRPAAVEDDGPDVEGHILHR